MHIHGGLACEPPMSCRAHTPGAGPHGLQQLALLLCSREPGRSYILRRGAIRDSWCANRDLANLPRCRCSAQYAEYDSTIPSTGVAELEPRSGATIGSSGQQTRPRPRPRVAVVPGLGWAARPFGASSLAARRSLTLMRSAGRRAGSPPATRSRTMPPAVRGAGRSSSCDCDGDHRRAPDGRPGPVSSQLFSCMMH